MIQLIFIIILIGVIQSLSDQKNKAKKAQKKGSFQNQKKRSTPFSDFRDELEKAIMEEMGVNKSKKNLETGVFAQQKKKNQVGWKNLEEKVRTLTDRADQKAGDVEKLLSKPKKKLSFAEEREIEKMSEEEFVSRIDEEQLAQAESLKDEEITAAVSVTEETVLPSGLSLREAMIYHEILSPPKSKRRGRR